MIEFKNVSYGYGEEPLSGLSFRLAAGSFTAVAGENGAGKSTLCRLAAALLRPTAGEVVSNGLCTSKEKGGGLRRLHRLSIPEPRPADMPRHRRRGDNTFPSSNG